ncbi:MAG: alcohol dehydrogenase catalytic domain-containing protein [Nitrososphaerota archaeon]|nr:alcohol dehydrogenase catalytic domain-containing protein [Nitrososphaerota archaeon]
MKAALVTALGEPLSIGEVPTPKIGSDDVLIKVNFCGLCYSDVKVWTGKTRYKPALPHILGHEIAGTVVDAGKNVSGLSNRDRVIVYLYDTCGKCLFCSTGKENLCQNNGPLIGFNRAGGFAEYVSIPSKNVFRIPDNLNFSDAAILADAVLTPYHAIVDRAQVKFNETAVLIGMGGLALSGLQVLKLMGARVIAVSRSESKLEMSRRFGADHVINSKDADFVQEVLRLTDGYGVDYVFDFVVNETTVDQGIRATKRGGKVMLLGYAMEPIPLNTGTMVAGFTTVQSSRAGTRQNLRDIIQIASEGKLKSVLTREFALEEANEALQLLKSGEITGRVGLRIEK